MKIGKLLKRLRSRWIYGRNLGEFRRQLRAFDERWPVRRRPCLDDRFRESGTASGHYFHQDLLVAQKVFGANPAKHVDIGSSIGGLVAHVASFRPIEVFDIRPSSINVPNVRFRQADIMDNNLGLDEYCDSLSCLHAIEHFGLGRYGDPVRVAGHRLAFHNLTRILETGGTLYLSTPIGPMRVLFDAHRVFPVRYLVEMVGVAFDTVSFSYVNDRGELARDARLSDRDVDANFGCRYGCGIFELRKR